MNFSFNQTDKEFFYHNGYINLGKILDENELEYIGNVFDLDREKNEKHWYNIHTQTINCDALFTSPEFDSIIRHPKILGRIGELMGDETCFSEICIRHMEPYKGGLQQKWHRDRPHLVNHPLRINFLQVMVYLTAVDENTHCFSLSPESVEEEILETKEQLERRGGVDLYGEAGTAIIFNTSVLHTATTRNTTKERKSIQIYYGHRNEHYLSEDSLIPTCYWKKHTDPEARSFYSVLNKKTAEYYKRVNSNLSFEKKLELLREIDCETGRRVKEDN